MTQTKEEAILPETILPEPNNSFTGVPDWEGEQPTTFMQLSKDSTPKLAKSLKRTKN